MKLPVFIIVVLIFLTSLCDTLSQLFLKSSINSLNAHLNSFRKIVSFILRLICTARVWVGFIFSTLSLFIWLFVLSKADLNFAFSIDSMHYILIALVSMWILKEKVTGLRWVGIGAIAVGIALVAVS